MAAGDLIVVRGGGDIASGTIHRLHRCGFRLAVLEKARPMAIRRMVSFAEAVYSGRQTVEGVIAELAASVHDCAAIWERDRIPVLVDPEAAYLPRLRPRALVDGILAKSNRGTHRRMAPVTIALGPGFTAGTEVDAVIETARGHDLGRVILQGSALPNTGIPGPVAGYTSERVLYARESGILTVVRDIGSRVEAGEVVATIGSAPVRCLIGGLVRGMLRHGSTVRKGLKVADIDPRPEQEVNCFTISDKARCISGGVLEALLFLVNKRDPAKPL